GDARAGPDPPTSEGSALLVTPPAVAWIVTVVVAATAVVAMANVALVDPWRTSTDAGTPASDGMPLARLIDVSLAAGEASVTVPVEPLVPLVDVGLSVSAAGACAGVAERVRVVDVLTPCQAAVMVTGVV